MVAMRWQPQISAYHQADHLLTVPFSNELRVAVLGRMTRDNQTSGPTANKNDKTCIKVSSCKPISCLLSELLASTIGNTPHVWTPHGCGGSFMSFQSVLLLSSRKCVKILTRTKHSISKALNPGYITAVVCYGPSNLKTNLEEPTVLWTLAREGSVRNTCTHRVEPLTLWEPIKAEQSTRNPILHCCL